MLLREVGYSKPSSVAEALSILSGNGGARALAGGQTLLNVMKARIASPEALIDLDGVDELKGIELHADGRLEIGAMVTYAELIGSAEARARPILGEVCAQIADAQVRNRGTIGGNVCANDPTNHLPPLMVALGATLTVAGPDGERTVEAEDFFLGVYLTAVRPDELLTKITIPPGRRDGFASVTIGRDGTCIVCAAASLDGGPRIAVGCVAAVPYRAAKVEGRLGDDLSPEAALAAARGLRAERRELGIHLDAGAQQQDAAFEFAEPEKAGQRVDGRPWPHLPPDIGAGSGGLRFVAEQALQTGKLRNQVRLVGVEPSVFARGLLHHVTCTDGPVNAGGVLVMSMIGLSMQSTRSRTGTE